MPQYYCPQCKSPGMVVTAYLSCDLVIDHTGAVVSATFANTNYEDDDPATCPRCNYEDCARDFQCAHDPPRHQIQCANDGEALHDCNDPACTEDEDHPTFDRPVYCNEVCKSEYLAWKAEDAALDAAEED
jgi:hypothetical protein